MQVRVHHIRKYLGSEAGWTSKSHLFRTGLSGGGGDYYQISDVHINTGTGFFIGQKEDPGNISINHSYLDTSFSVLGMEVKYLHMLGKPSVAELHFQLSVLTPGQNEDNLVTLAIHASVQALEDDRV